jgi:deoxyribonuclease IV
MLVFMRFGFHISIAGSLTKVAERAVAVGCETLQIFTRSPRVWAGREIDPAEAASLKTSLSRYDIRPLFVHLPYLPNLSAPPGELYEKSLKMLCDDLFRSHLLEAYALVIHPGHRGDCSIDAAIHRTACSINTAFSSSECCVKILFENTAGQGKEIGSTFIELSEIIDLIKDKDRVGICLDTAHAFAAGYDLSTKNGLNKTMREIDRVIGLEHLDLIHLNDSRSPMGSKVDRHWHIGEGEIGIEGFRMIVNHPALTGKAAIMETPKINKNDDIRNMNTVRKLFKS